MVYKSCAARIAASIQQDCNRPLVGGYTGRAVLMSATDFERAEVVRSADNPRKIMSVVLPVDGSVKTYTVDNVFAQPFTGSTTVGNNDDGRNGYLKTVSVRVPMRGADVSKNVIEPLVKDPNGFVMMLEKRDKVGDGSYEVIGYQNALRGDIAGVTRDESANGGDWIVPLTTVEKWAEVTLVGAEDTYESARNEFEELMNWEPSVFEMDWSLEYVDFSTIQGNGNLVIEMTLENDTVVKDTIEETDSSYNRNFGEDIVKHVKIYGQLVKLADDDGGAAYSKNVRSSGKSYLKEYTYMDGTLETIDLSNATELEYIKLGDMHCTIESLNLSSNKKLQTVNLHLVDIMLLNVSNLSNVNSFNLSVEEADRQLSTILVSGANYRVFNSVETFIEGTNHVGKLYVDENTPQSLIVAAEAKNWEVIYQA